MRLASKMLMGKRTLTNAWDHFYSATQQAHRVGDATAPTDGTGPHRWVRGFIQDFQDTKPSVRQVDSACEMVRYAYEAGRKDALNGADSDEDVREFLEALEEIDPSIISRLDPGRLALTIAQRRAEA